MSSDMVRNCLNIGLLLVAVIFPCVAMGQPSVYYYQGDRRVEVRVRLDLLDVTTTAPLQSLEGNVQRILPGARVKPPKNNDRLVVEVHAADLPMLNAKAKALRSAAPGAQVRAVLQPSETAGNNAIEVLSGEVSFKLKEKGAGSSASLAALTKKYGLVSVQPVAYAGATYVGRLSATADLLAPIDTANRMQESGEVKWAAPQVLRKQVQRAVPNDPFFSNQWHLKNNGTNTLTGVSGEDLNVVPAWDIATGIGVNIAITDSGVETTHTDLMANVRTDLDYDFNYNDTYPPFVDSLY